MHHTIPGNKNSTDSNIFNPKNLIILCRQCYLKAHDGAYKRLDTALAKILTEKLCIKDPVMRNGVTRIPRINIVNVCRNFEIK
jgi:hypothetical protein